VIERIQLVRNIGQFDSVDGGAIQLTKLVVCYAENSRGKTTLAAIFRSLSTGAASWISERARLGAAHSPHVVVGAMGVAPFVFQNGAWSAHLPTIAVFDDRFVADNVCSGIEISTEHRQNLHELILGAQGVTLSNEVQRHVAAVEVHNREIKACADAIPAAARGDLSADQFCDLEPDPAIASRIESAERALAAAEAAQEVAQAEAFDSTAFALPPVDIEKLQEFLERDLPDLEAEAAGRVQAHIQVLGEGAEAWLAEGISRKESASAQLEREFCPYCAQDLSGSPLISHYRAYFGEAYARLKSDIAGTVKYVEKNHGGEVAAAFERTVRVAVQRREFWQRFLRIPKIELDTARIARAWYRARDNVLAALNAKQASPLERIALSESARREIAQHNRGIAQVAAVREQLEVINGQIAIVKERAAAANITTLTADLAMLRAVAARQDPTVTALCDAYRAAKLAKARTEELRNQARVALDQYRVTIFPAYENAINDYLRKFNAGFRLTRVASTNTRGGSACTYSVVINRLSVAVTAGTAGGPAFRNTLSACDRNALALAFFFASLDRDPRVADKVVVIDDPMTSLDEHRSLTTIQEVRRSVDRVAQVIVLSHSKTFLAHLWEGADRLTRSAFRIIRRDDGSTLEPWDVTRDCITDHDRRHALVIQYLARPDPVREREVATALRHILEAFVRVAYPDNFPPGSLLGPFLNICRQRVNTNQEVLDGTNISELQDLLEYANRFHHDTNPVYQTEYINDQELRMYCERTLHFARR
jgi:wobble nucleotide-excising tRNase